MVTIQNGLSFDVEDWFQVGNYEGVIPREEWDACELRVVESTRRVLEILQAYEVRATFFVLGWVAERAPEVVQMILERGHEVGSHGYAHRRVTDLSPETFRADLLRSIDVIGQAGATAIRGFRAPSFSIVPASQWALQILSKTGFRYDSSIFPSGLHPRYGLPDAPLAPYKIHDNLWEVPLTVLEVLGHRLPVGGGGYFRLFPYTFTRWALRRINQQGRAVVVYLHPWELDPGQPRVRTAAWRQFRQRVNLHRTVSRLKRLLTDFQFVPLGEMIDA